MSDTGLQYALDVALIGCSKSKNLLDGTPEELYAGRLLHLHLAYARRVLQLPDECIFILSARHGLVALDQKIAHYDLALSSLSITKRQSWGRQVVSRLLEVAPGVCRVWMMAGNVYSTAVSDSMRYWDIERLSPHPAGLGIGQQLAWYKQALAGVG
jgi:hypothetical protein